MEVLGTVATSRDSARCEDIILRVTETTRLVFRPQLVNNVHDGRAPLRGTFIWQKKRQRADWQDYQLTSLAHLKDGEGIKLELRAGEVLQLLQGLESYRQLYEQFGIGSGARHFLVTSRNVEDVIKQLAKFKDVTGLAEKLQKVNVEQLEAVQTVVGLSRMKKVLAWWEDNKNSANEDLFQRVFSKHPWILSQVFPYPVVVLREKAYVGGKGIDNAGGGVVDFLLAKDLLDNVVLVEIKHPGMPLVSTLYREPDVFSMSAPLTGAINQVLSYKDRLLKNYNALVAEHSTKFCAFNPHAIVIAGKLDRLDAGCGQRKSFELFRNDLRNVEIITFDEMFGKIRHLIEILEEI